MISDAVSLSDKLGREERALVPKEGTFDARLPVAAVFRSAPDKGSIACNGSQNDLVARANDEVRGALGFAAAVVAAVEVADAEIAVFREPPTRPKGRLALATEDGSQTDREPHEGALAPSEP